MTLSSEAKVFKLGTAADNDIQLRATQAQKRQATIRYIKGEWLLENLAPELPIYLNEIVLKDPKALNKYDRIKLADQTIHWQDYFYEGETQELITKDFKSFHGRISRSNYRALSLLTIGLIICIFFVPGILGTLYSYLLNRGAIRVEMTNIEVVQFISPYFYFLGYSLLGLLFVMISVKRIRDTGNPWWKLLLPFYNLKLLYFNLSKI
ncbi:MAG: DUF805 domain-containing protein [Saprospiraceae bacterium]